MREYWKKHRSNKKPHLSELTTVLDNRVPIHPTGWALCLHVTTIDNTSPNANKFAALQTEDHAPQAKGVREELRRLQDQLARLGRRLHDTLESSSSRTRSRIERYTPSRYAPPNRRGYATSIPSHQSMWSRHYDYDGRPRTTQQWRAHELTQGRRFAPIPTSPRREVQVSRQHERNVPTTAWQQATPAPRRAPPQARHVHTENQRKRERRRRNRHALYRELEELVLRHTQLRIRADGQIR